MGRSHFHPGRCKSCGIHNSEARISVTGLCRKCGDERRDANIEQLENRAGPFYEHWLLASALAVRRRVVAWEASQAEPQGVQSDG